MKTIVTAIALLFCLPASAIAANDACAYYDGAVVINSDNEYIGSISNSYSSDSIFNEYGRYGSEYRTESIWNEYGKNGSEYRSDSAFNEYTRSPPRIVKDRAIIGFLSVNKSLRGAVNPLILGISCYDFKPPR